MADQAVKARGKTADPEVVRLRAALDALGVSWHHFSGADKLRAQLAEASGAPVSALSTQEAEPAPARSRAATEGRRRRARGGNDLSHLMKLGVGFELDPNYEYRWINGGLDDQRLHNKTEANVQGGDWEPVTRDGQEASDSTGTVLRRAVGTNQADQVQYAYLCRKPKALYDEDHQAIQALNDKRIQAIHRGAGTAPGETSTPDGIGYGQETVLSGEARKAIKV